MAEPKPIASLSSGLLARKGAARPAMRRQGLGMGGMMSHPLPDDGFAEDLGWNDMGYDVDPAHEEGAPQYGNLLAGAIPETLAEPMPARQAAQPQPQRQPEPEPEPEPELQLEPLPALIPMLEAPAPVEPAAVINDVVRQQAEIAERLAEPVAEIAPVATIAEPEAPVAAAEPQAPAPVLAVRKRKQAELAEVVATAAAPQGRRAAFTLRLDADRHLKLRLASAVTGQSAQQLVTAALDELLTKIPEIEDLAGRVPRSATR